MVCFMAFCFTLPINLEITYMMYPYLLAYNAPSNIMHTLHLQ